MTILRKAPFGVLKIYILQTNLIRRLYLVWIHNKNVKSIFFNFQFSFFNIYKLLENKFSNNMAANFITILECVFVLMQPIENVI